MNCRVCASSRLERFLDLGDQPHCDSLLRPEDLSRREPYYPLQVCFCHDCTTVQINYTVPKEEMFSEYLYVSGTTQTLRSHFEKSAARQVQRLGLKPNDLVVDIGSNDGTWLSYFAKHGLRTVGVDCAQNLAAMANARGIETINDFFNLSVAQRILAEKGPAKLVTAAGVFFHLEELHSVTEGIAALVRDGGAFCVQAIYLGAMLKDTQFDQVYHEHLTYWTVRSLDHLFAQHGLEITSVEPLDIHGGSIEAIVAPRGTRAIDPSVDRYRAEEDRLGYGQIETYRRFADQVWKIRDELWRILNQYLAAGKTVHAFGAPAKGATLLNSFQITHEHLPYAAEKNPLKCGKYIPGARIPIVDEDSIDPPDAYLVLAWNFLGEFLKKKKDYLLNRGDFIVPIPWPMVINRDNYEEFAPKG